MSPDLSRQDLVLLDRYLDAALSADEQVTLRRRLDAEPLLRQGLQQRSQLRRGFHAGRAAVFTAPVGFADGVLAAARRLPHVEIGAVAGRFCRRLLLAAAAVLLAALVWQSGLLREQGNGTLEAAPDAAQRVIDALDAKIHAGATDPTRK